MWPGWQLLALIIGAVLLFSYPVPVIIGGFLWLHFTGRTS